MIVLLCIGCLVLGITVGIGLIFLIIQKSSAGDLRIDRSEPAEEPYLFLEIHKNPKDIYSKKYVIFRVNLKNYISHK